MSTLLLSGLSRHPLRISEDSGVVISIIERAFSTVFYIQLHERKTLHIVNSSVANCLVDHRRNTLLDSQAQCEFNLCMLRSPLSNLLLHAYRLGATMGLLLMTWPPWALPRAMPLSLNPTIGRYLSLEST